MPNQISHYTPRGRHANEIVADVERAIMCGELRPGAQLPTVRALANELLVSPTTIAAAYRFLGLRGLVRSEGRRGTAVSAAPPVGMRAASAVPAGAHNLLTGNPDAALLPNLCQHLQHLKLAHRLYGEATNLPDLLALATRDFAADGIAADHLAVVAGALDGVERVLQAHLRPGDNIAIEDPGYPPIIDLTSALGLVPISVRVDDFGPLSEDFEAALRKGAKAAIVTPRAQNPFGSALTEVRARELRGLLKSYPAVLVIEDDHAGPVASAAAITLSGARRDRWAVIRSVSKWLGPDLRLALMAGDPLTISRVEGRQGLGTGWVSHILQRLVLALWSDRKVVALVKKARETYAARRLTLVNALAKHNIKAYGYSGLTVWVPVTEELSVVQNLMQAGWAVAGGERYRIKSSPAIRIGVGALRTEEMASLAGAVAHGLSPAHRSHSA